jgi:microcystin-dependent protein
VANPYLGEIRIFAFNFAPVGWIQCSGQLLPISQYTALFSLLGTFYGGNGTSNFALPNLQSRIRLGMGAGTGLSTYSIGQTGGTETVTLTAAQMPEHSHPVHAAGTEATTDAAVGHLLAKSKTHVYAKPSASTPLMNSAMIADAGDGEPHNNIQPYLALNFCIAYEGIFPSRS